MEEVIVWWICNFYGEEKQGTYTRVKAHLLKITRQGIGVCQKVRVENITEMRKMEDEVTNRISNSQPKRVPLPTATSTTIGSPSLPLSNQSVLDALKRIRTNDSPLGRAFDM